MRPFNAVEHPSVRGCATLRVIGPDGEIKQEVKGENMLLRPFWEGLLSSGPYHSTNLHNIRTYISDDKGKPYPQQTHAHVIGQGTDHPQGHYSRGVESLTDNPYIEIRNLYQVTGVQRTIYSIGLMSWGDAPNNVDNTNREVSTRLLLSTPVVQDISDQLDLEYRVYFEESPSSSTHEAYWAEIVDWAFTVTYEDTFDYSLNRTGGIALGTAGTTWQKRRASYNSPGIYNGSANQNHGPWVRVIEANNFNNTDSNTDIESDYQALYLETSSFETDRTYMVGDVFNEWWPRESWTVGNADWMGNDSGFQDSSIYSRHLVQSFHATELDLVGPFHNSFNHSASSMKLTYDVNGLPETTWRATFGGTWPTADKYPLFARMWWSTGGALDGSTAKYKLAFCRTLGTTRGYARDEHSYYFGTGDVDGQAHDQSGYGNDHVSLGRGLWTLFTDLHTGHGEYQNSRFGNYGLYQQSGWSGSTKSHAFDTSSNGKALFNVRKYPGLTTNSWWGFQSGKYGKSNHLGVEFRTLDPFNRQVWQKADISSSLNQIDWLEPVNGLPGEVDDEMALVVDQTSGIYLINATQDSVTTITTQTGFTQANYTRDPSSNTVIYTAYKFTASGLEAYSSADNFVSSVFDYDGEIGGSTSGTLSNGVHDTSYYGASITAATQYSWPNNSSLTDLVPGSSKNIIRTNLHNNSNNQDIYFYSSRSNHFDLSGDFTLELWVYKTRNLDNEIALSIGYQNAFQIDVGYNGGVITGSSSTSALFTQANPEIETWHHIAVVRSGTTVSVYKNGAFHSSFTSSDDYSPATNYERVVLFNQTPRTTSEEFQGHIYSARITKNVRYTGAFTPSDFSLDDASSDSYYSDTLLHVSGEPNPFEITSAGDFFENGVHTNLSLTGSVSGSGAKCSVKVEANEITQVSVFDRGTGYKATDTLTVAPPAALNPDYGQVLTLDSTSLVGGSGYVSGTYSSVPMQGGSGQNAEATIEVVSNAVVSVTLSAGGSGYIAGELLYANDSDLGNSGVGAGFSIDVGSINANQYYTTVAPVITVDSIATKAPNWWTTYSDSFVILRRHYREPDVFVGLVKSGNGSRSAYIDLNGSYAEPIGSFHEFYSSAMYAFIGEFFGDPGEGDSGITKFDIYNSNVSNLRDVAFPDMVTFTPDCSLASVFSFDFNDTNHPNEVERSLVKLSKTVTGNRDEIRGDIGKASWCSPHSAVSIPNFSDNTYPHYCVTNVASLTSSSYRYRGESPLENAIIVKGINRSNGDQSEYEQRGNVASQMGSLSPNYHDIQGSTGYELPSKGASVADIIDHRSSGKVFDSNGDPYKGLTTNGQVVGFCAPMWASRNASDIGSHRTNYPSAWPIDGGSDPVIMHPMRWDVYGWDSSGNSWVKEDWSYDYDNHEWKVDSSTVYPGRPAPSSGGTQNLTGINQYPYSNLTVTFTDVRPTNTTNPVLGEWTGQYLYNGAVFDAVNEFEFAKTLSSRPIDVSAISQTIPSSGRIRVPESYETTFIRLLTNYDGHHSLKIDGTDAAISFSNDFQNLPPAGTIWMARNELIFNSSDVGKTLTGTYAFAEYAPHDSPANWRYFEVSNYGATDGTTTGLLGGASYKTNSNLSGLGWTLVSSSNATKTIFASNHSTDFPSGFFYFAENSDNFTSASYAESIVISNTNIGFYFGDNTTDQNLYDSTDFGEQYGNQYYPSYGGMQWAYDSDLELLSIHKQLHTDANSDNWLVIRCQHRENGTSNYIISEIWISRDDPAIYEFRIGDWDRPSSDYTFNMVTGIFYRNSSYVSYYRPGSFEWGSYEGWTYGNVNTSFGSPWGGFGPDDWANSRFKINLDPHDLF